MKGENMPKQITAKPLQYKATDIANYFIWKARKEGKPISNKKLQKLLYYSQAWHLVLDDGKPLFDEDFEAWVHGPVIPSIYQKYKKYGFNPIDKKIDHNPIDDEKTSFLDQIWDIYGKLDAEYLELLTHREEPWQSARDGLESKSKSNTTIDRKLMKKYYEKKLHAK